MSRSYIRWSQGGTLLHTRGGRSLLWPQIGADCTSGFTARTDSGVRGVLTAGHCDNSDAEYYQTASIHYPLATYYNFQRVDADYQYMKERPPVTHPEVEPKFWSGENWRWVENGQSPNDSVMLGDLVCFFGRNSGGDCATVMDSTFDPGDWCGANSDGPCDTAFVKFDATAAPGTVSCQEGDSGGPVFSSTRAYGVLMGGDGVTANPTLCHWMVFTKTNRIEKYNIHILEH